MKKKTQTPQTETAPGIRAEEAAVLEWIKTVKFKKVMFGGVDEKDVWKKIDELNGLYEKLIIAVRAEHASNEPVKGGDKADE